MRVNTTDGVLSLPHQATDTAECCSFFDHLFDSLNASVTRKSEKEKKWIIPITAESDHIAFWNTSLKVINTMYYFDEENHQKKIPPVLTNLITTINNFKIIVTKLLRLGFQEIWPATFNQDPIENLFGQIRQRACRDTNPTFSSFGPLYKSLLIKICTGNHAIGRNVEGDNSTIFFTLKELLRPVCIYTILFYF